MEVPGKKPEIKLSSTIAHGSQEDLQLFCTPCDKMGPRLPAFGFCTDCKEHLCKDCFQHHTKPKPCRNHVLLDGDSMPKKQQTSLVTSKKQIKPLNDLTKPCHTHKNRIIEYYCLDHSKLLCNVCVTLKHSPNTCTVKYIPDISGEAIDSKELKDIVEQMDTIIQECQTVGKTSKDMTRESDNSLVKALKDIKKCRMDINKRLDDLESVVEVKVKHLQEENKQRLHITETICGDVNKSVTELKSTIIQTNKVKQADKLFIDMKTAQQEMYEYKASIRDLTEVEDVNAYYFKPNASIMSTITTLGSLESEQFSTKMEVKQPRLFSAPLRRSNEAFPTDVKQNRVKMPIFASKDDAFLKNAKQNRTEVPLFAQKDIPYNGDLCVRATSDTHRCWITGMTQLNSDHLVVADYNNKSVKILQTKEGTVKSTQKLSSKPWDVTITPNNELAVTLPYDNMIQFLSTKSNKLSLSHSSLVHGQCSGISYCDNKMVVTYIDPLKCEVLDMKGNVLSTIRGESDGKYTLTNPSYVTSTYQAFYISDCGARRIIKLNWQGRVIDSFKDKGQYKGISLSTDGTLYVCEQGSHSNISMIQVDFKERRRVIEEYRRPQAICCWNNGLLYISNHCYTDTDNFLRIYKTK